MDRGLAQAAQMHRLIDANCLKVEDSFPLGKAHLFIYLYRVKIRLSEINFMFSYICFITKHLFDIRLTTVFGFHT